MTTVDDMRDDDPYRTRTSDSVQDGRTFILKHDDTFAVVDRRGDIYPGNAVGVIHDGTRILSHAFLRFRDASLVLLGSEVTTDNQRLVADFTNPTIRDLNGRDVPPHSLHLRREGFVWQGAWHERVTVRNYTHEMIRVELVREFGADFADLFEIRGMQRQQRGTYGEPVVTGQSVHLSYLGLDGERRTSTIAFLDTAQHVSGDRATYDIALGPGEERTFDFVVSGGSIDVDYDASLARLRTEMERRSRRGASLHTRDGQVQGWITRSHVDLRMLETVTATGPYPYAGVPWFSTPFGRDGIITALQTLWLDPDLSAGVLRYLAAYQATTDVPEREAQPGRIMHEARGGEMAALGEIPFGLYYGSTDVTPLFVMLADAYFRRTADAALIDEIWPNIQAALQWMVTEGDPDGDGFVEYSRHTSRGLYHQGWKDSHDSIFHADGSEPPHPIALCEVQAYVFGALLGASNLATVRGETLLAQKYQQKADHLRASFDRAFWLDDLGTYAIALDGDKRPCRVRSSNAGHCLFTGITTPVRARVLAAGLLDDRMFSGYGIRTIAEGEARYNPISYHNGSVWPHDSAMISMGLARYGCAAEALSITEGLYAASLGMEFQRMPELFCGFVRQDGSGPVPYPVACSPQAWGAGSVFMMLAACLGIEIDAPGRCLTLSHPRLPGFLDELTVNRLQVGNAEVDLRFQRSADEVEVDIIRRVGDIDLVIER